jgi:hypothetical protein
MRRPLPLHPLLLAALPVLALYAHNMSEVRTADLVWPLVIVGIGSALLWLALRVLLRDAVRAALAASLFWVWFFLFGHLRGLLPSTPSAIFAVAYGAILVLGMALLLDQRPWLPTLSSGINVAAGILVAWQIVAIGGHELQRLRIAPRAVDSVPAAETHPAQSARYPNIYYVVLDAYGRADVLRDLYRYDNIDLLGHLRQRGFHVARYATSNYALTTQSLASSLNFRYVHDGAPGTGADAGAQGISRDTIADSRLSRFLRQRGYRVVTFASGTAVTDCIKADIRMEPASSLSEFQNTLLNATPLPLVFALVAPMQLDPLELHRRRVRYAFDHLADTTKLRPPVFVFAHIVCPHHPFVFDRNGDRVGGSGALTLEDADSQADGRGTYVRDYAEQARFVSRETRAAIDAILEQADRPTVIVVQSDHGPGSRTVWGRAERTDLRERFGILLAYYLSGDRDVPMADNITPVNVFRVLLNRYFATDLPLLPNENYFPAAGTPGRFIRVTDQVQAPASAH